MVSYKEDVHAKKNHAMEKSCCQMRDWCIIYIGIIKIPLFKDVLVKNPSNCRLESFINPGIVRIEVIEIPLIKDLQ